MSICAFDKGEECKALKEKNCKGCPFFKTEEELERGRQKALARIRSLPKAVSRRLYRKYYQQRRSNHPWCE